jgi:hypothetical protein
VEEVDQFYVYLFYFILFELMGSFDGGQLRYLRDG